MRIGWLQEELTWAISTLARAPGRGPPASTPGCKIARNLVTL